MVNFSTDIEDAEAPPVTLDLSRHEALWSLNEGDAGIPRAMLGLSQYETLYSTNEEDAEAPLATLDLSQEEALCATTVFQSLILDAMIPMVVMLTISYLV